MAERADVVIVGGGPAGAAAACRLASAGRRVVLCEREAHIGPRVCGEFLSPGACAELQDLGIEPHAMGAARIERMRLVHGRTDTRSPLPFEAWGLSRERLDQALLARAAACGAEVRRGAAVRRLDRDGETWRATLADGTDIRASVVLLATGKHDLRGHRRPKRTRADTIGFKMHWRLAPAQALDLAHHIELVWFDGGYAGLQPVENGLANLCLVLRADAYGRLGRSWPRLLAWLRQTSPHLGVRLNGARPLWRRPAMIAGMPYGWIYQDDGAHPGLYRLGDQFAVIPSFTGEGVALALRTARLAADAMLAGAPAATYHHATRAAVLGAMRNAAGIGRLGEHRLGRRIMVPVGHIPGVLPALARATRLRESPRNAA